MLSSATIVERSHEQNLDRVFRALSDRTRRKLLARLADGSAMVTELAEPFDMSLPAVGKHLRVLENAGLVKRSICGRVHTCSLDALPLKEADEWLAHYQEFWTGTLNALSGFVQADDGESS